MALQKDDATALQELDALKKAHGEFTAHNIKLSENIFTIGKDSVGGWGRHGRFVSLITSVYGDDLSKIRVLDLACNEGITAIECAKLGAESVGIEIRETHVKKAQGVASILGLHRTSFNQDDVRNVTLEKYGYFDVVVCSGILYHLDQPDVFNVVRNIAGACSRLLIIDTTTAPKGIESVTFEGNIYYGRRVREHNAEDNLEERAARTWASIDNTYSFLLTKASMINLMARSGVKAVSELKMPFKYREGFHRLTLFGFRTPSVADFAKNSTSFPEQPAAKRTLAHNPRRAPNALSVESVVRK